MLLSYVEYVWVASVGCKALVSAGQHNTLCDFFIYIRRTRRTILDKRL